MPASARRASSNSSTTIAWRFPPLAVGAVGQMDVFPNSRNVIQGKVVFTVDFRHPDKAILDRMEDAHPQPRRR